jgi:hypothetical protein
VTRRETGAFSANSEGACPKCNGAGLVYADLAMMAGVATTCEERDGKRFESLIRFGSSLRSPVKQGLRIIRWHPLNSEAAALAWAAEQRDTP